MNLGKKLAAGLLVAGTMTGAFLSVGSPAHAATGTSIATSTSTTTPAVGFPRWVNFGFYPDENSCATEGRALLKSGSNVGDWRCMEIGSGPEAGNFLLQLLITPP